MLHVYPTEFTGDPRSYLLLKRPKTFCEAAGQEGIGIYIAEEPMQIVT
jgi:hypothetical protein